MHIGGLRRVEETAFFKAVEGQDTKKKSYDIGYKAEVAQNCRFGDEVGSVTKRPILAYYNTTEETAATLPSAIDSIYRYYKQTGAGGQYLFQLNNNLLRVGDDSAGTFSTLWTLSASGGKRFTAVTYKDLAIISTGYDNILVSDGLAAWELGSCKATLKAEAGNVNNGAHYYAWTCLTSTGGSTTRTGSCTTETASKLTDSTANFGAEAVPTEIGWVVTNTTDDTWALVTAIDSTTVLSISADIFALNDTYSMDVVTTEEIVNGAFSNTVTTSAGNQKVTLSNIPLGPVNTTVRKIYRTAAGGSELKLLTTLLDNSTVTYEDNIADASLTTTMPAVTDDMPKGKYLHVTDERLFVSGDTSHGSYMYFSEQYLPHYFLSDNYDIVGEDEGDVITGIRDLLSQTFIFKQNSIRPYFISGLPETWSQGKIISTIGAPAPYSITNVQDGIIYQGWDHMYKFNGQYSVPILDDFPIDEEILETRQNESVGFFWNNLFLMAYTDLDDANTYHDRVLVYDTLRNQLSIDKGGAHTTLIPPGNTSYGNLQINCFTAMKGGNEWGQLYGGDSYRGFVYQYERVINEAVLTTKTDIDLGTHSSTMAVGLEEDPILTKLILDNMETYKTDALAQAAWVTSETAALEDIPPDLGTGADGAPTISTGTWSSDKNCTTLTVDADDVITVNGEIYVKVQGTFTNAGTINIDAGSTLYIWANTITNTGTINGNVYTKSNTLNNSGTMANDIIKSSVHSGSGGSAEASGWDANWSTAHTDTKTSTASAVAAVMLEAWHTFPTTTTLSSVKLKASASRDSGSAYSNQDVYIYLRDSSGNDIAYTGSAGVNTTVSIDTTYTTMGAVAAPWADVKQIYIRVRSIAEQSTPGTAVTGNIYDIAAYADIHCAYKNYTGTVPTSESTSDFVNALDVYSEAVTINEGTYAIKVICGTGANTLNDYLTKSIESIDLSASPNDHVLIDVYALRSHASNSYIQFGLYDSVTGGGTWTYVNMPITVSNTWQTLNLDFGAVTDKTAITQLRIKFTNTDAYNRVYVDNIRTALYASATYTSQVFHVNAGTMGQMLWNEDLAVVGATTYGNVLVYTRTGATSVACQAAAWSDALTTPTGSDIVSTANDYFQFKVVLSSTDTTGVNFPFLYKADGYVIKATYWKAVSVSESSIIFRYKTGYRNFDLPFADKIFKKIVSVHEGTTDTFDLIVDIRSDTYTFSAISLATYPTRWVSNFPADMYAPELSLEWYKNDDEDFKVKQYGVVIEPTPLI